MQEESKLKPRLILTAKTPFQAIWLHSTYFYNQSSLPKYAKNKYKISGSNSYTHIQKQSVKTRKLHLNILNIFKLRWKIFECFKDEAGAHKFKKKWIKVEKTTAKKAERRKTRK